ncbi:SCO family protein [Marinicella sp. W31]|uniref:SCO family protein n=1 Tax=Marinicella sp. W31 TaxID=3023713 RepID=UPI0037578292
MNSKIVLLVVVLVAAAGAAFVYQQRTTEEPKPEINQAAPQQQLQQPEISFQTLKLFPKTKVFSGYTLTDQHGQTFNQESFKGNWSVVFFGFTNCPDICPTTLLDMQKIHRSLSDDGIQPPRFVFVSVDSDRDSPENMKTYIDYFNSEFVGLSGDAGNILSLTTQLGVAYEVEPHETDAEFYNVDHSAALFLINPEAERAGIFTTPHDHKQITADLKSLLSQS